MIKTCNVFHTASESTALIEIMQLNWLENRSECSDFILPILQPNTGCFPIQKKPVRIFQFWRFFSQPEDLLGFFPNSKSKGCIPKKAIKSLECVTSIYSTGQLTVNISLNNNYTFILTHEFFFAGGGRVIFSAKYRTEWDLTIYLALH